MRKSVIHAITLADFRSYVRADLRPEGRSVYLFGPNGAGKTNLLEGLSLLAPGRGLRGSAMAEMGRRMPGEALGRPWAVSVLLQTDEGQTRLGAGTDAPGAARRLVRIDGEPAAPGRMAAYLRPIWLTPAQDRLFLDGSSERRRFFDRLTYAAEPRHAEAASAYEKAMRERLRLLVDGPDDPVWLKTLESQMAQAGAAVSTARARTLTALQAEIDARVDRPFPQAALDLSGAWERLALAGVAEAQIEARLAEALSGARDRDRAAGRSLTGPHRGDLTVLHRGNDRPAAECSTGEQKALILNLVLAQASRLSRAESAPNPIVLLDEVAAHLDPFRRASLFEEITALGLQAFLTGADQALFADLKGRAMGVAVDAGQLAVLDN